MTRAAWAKFGIVWLLVVPFVAAQNTPATPASVQDVKVLHTGVSVQVQVTLSRNVEPSVVTAKHPDRIVLRLPNTVADARQEHIPVNYLDIRSVRFGLHSSNPPATHLVVDLDHAHSYDLQVNGPQITLTIDLAVIRAHQGAPPAGKAGAIIAIFQRRPKYTPPSGDTGPIADVPAAPSTPHGPIIFPDEQTKSTTPATTQDAQTKPPAVSPAAPAAPALPVPAPAPSPQATQATSAVAQSGTRRSLENSANSSASAEPPTPPAIADSNLRTIFRVKYVAAGVAYLDGGRSSGLAEGMKLEIKDSDLPPKPGTTADPSDPLVVAELEVSAVADSSAVTNVHIPKRPVRAGDWAYLSSADAAALVQQRTLSPTRKYPAVVTFTEGDPLDEEVREEVPRPPLPSVNRARGRIGFDYMGTMSHGSPGATSSDLGLVLRADITRINGTYWNLSGYWRGRLAARSSSSQPTLQDLINRTYHLSMTYDNPGSHWVAGFGRLYLPWAPSLDTIDGGYFGRHLAKGITTGIFAGSTPDPTSWNFSPDRRIGGAFINFEGGNYDALHYTSTSGLGISTLKWKIDRPFVFFENSVSYNRYISIYDSLQADSPRGNPAVPAPGAGLSRNFLTIRLQPHPRLELDFNHNYFRDIPTFDPQLIGTGLLDKYLFQGFSVGARVEVLKQVFLYTDIGRSNRSGDARNSWNQAYGITVGQLPWLRLRADAHYSRFNSSFGDGSYRAFSLSREFGENFRLELLAGDQSLNSPFSGNDRSRFLTGNVESSLGAHYFFQGGFTVNRGQTLNYDQWLFTFGYRFDSKAKHK